MWRCRRFIVANLVAAAVVACAANAAFAAGLLDLKPLSVPAGGNTLPGAPSLPTFPATPHVRAPLSADAAALVAGNNAFALDMYHRLSSNSAAKDNLLVSPLSISAALGMTFAG